MKTDYAISNNLATEFSNYRLSIFPGQQVKHSLKEIVEEFEGKPDDQDYELILMKFSIRNAFEDTMLRFLDNLMRRQSCFDLALNNFGGDPHGSIFLRLMGQEKIERFLSSFEPLGGFIQADKGKFIRYFGNQSVYLWRNLTEDVFRQRMLQLSQQTFHESFPVDTFYLFREDNAYKTSRLVQIFRLKGSECFTNN